MEKKLSKRKMLRRKYVSALAGAAILTGAAGMAAPATTFAAERPVVAASASSQSTSGSHYDTRSNSGSHYDTRYNNGSNNNTTRSNSKNVTHADTRNNGAHYDTRSNNGSHYDTRYDKGSRFDTRFHSDSRYYDTSRGGSDWHRHDRSWPSSNDNRGLYKDGKIYYSSDNNGYYNDYNNHYEYANYRTSPLTFAKDYASSYGFDASRDSFSLLSQSRNQATVQIIQHDTNQRFRVDLVRSQDGGWNITGVRGIGNVAAAYR
jgi:hypothetical protein